MPICFSTPKTSAMAEALELTRSGRLAEATAAIQRAVGGWPPSSDVTHSVQQMPDVPVPATRALTDGHSAEPQARTVNAPHRARPPQGTPTPSADRTGPQRAPRPPTTDASRVTSPDFSSLPGLGSLPDLGSLPGLGSLLDLKSLLDLGSFPGLGSPDLAALPRLPGGASASTSRPYRLHVPDQLPDGPRPLLVLLHGGTQDAASFAHATGFDVLADEHGFLALYPEQVTGANPMRYWNWFNRSDQQRGSGEPAIIAGLVEEIAAQHDIDPSRVFVAGFSAGAAMSSVLGATYPDVFAGIGVHSGLAHGAAGDMISAFSAMGKAPAAPAVQALPVIVIHGGSDSTVHVSNAASVLGQFAPAAATRRTFTEQANGRNIERTIVEAGGRAVAERIVIAGAGHTWSGGRPGGSYADPSGPDAAAEMVRFFGLTSSGATGQI